MIFKTRENSEEVKVGCANFSGQDINFDGRVFTGTELEATFGCVECDLRKAIIKSDCSIKINVLFGAIDILVPNNVNITINSESLFGKVSNKTNYAKDSAYTIYINGSCMFGGVEIK